VKEGLIRNHHDFRWYWAGQTISLLGTQVTATAMPLVAALTLDGGAGGVSVVATAGFLPNLVLPLLAGHWLEGRGKRRIMVAADLLRFALVLTVPLAWATGRLSLPLMAAVAFAVCVASVFFDIGGFAYVPSIVPRKRLGEANRAMQGSATVSQVSGPGLAGVLVQTLGAPLALAVDAISYLASAVGVNAARRPEPSQTSQTRGRIRDGLVQILTHPVLRPLTMHAAIYNAAAQIFVVNLVVWTVTQNDVPPGVYGLALSAGGVGAFIGTMLALRLADRLGFGGAFLASLSLSCGIPLFTAALPWTGGALGYGLAGLQMLAGVGLGSANVLSITLRQTVIPQGQLARTNGAYRSLMYGSIPIGSALAGILGEALGSRAGVAIGTVGLTISALPMLARSIRQLHQLPTPPPMDSPTTLDRYRAEPGSRIRRSSQGSEAV
jgi:MFS family permease